MRGSTTGIENFQDRQTGHPMGRVGWPEEVAYLLLHDDLPDRRQLDRFPAQLGAERNLPDQVVELLRQAPSSVHPMALLRTAVSALSFFDEEVQDNSHEANVRKTIRLLAKIPTAITAGYRLGRGEDPVAPQPELGPAGNLLYMLRGAAPA